MADSSSWMASSGSGGFCLHIFVCISIWLGDYSSLCCMFTRVYLFACAHQARCNTLVSQHPRLSVLAVLCAVCLTLGHTGRLFCQCNTLECSSHLSFFFFSWSHLLAPDGGERRILRSGASQFCHTHLEDSGFALSLSLSPSVELFPFAVIKINI